MENFENNNNEANFAPEIKNIDLKSQNIEKYFDSFSLLQDNVKKLKEETISFIEPKILNQEQGNRILSFKEIENRFDEISHDLKSGREKIIELTLLQNDILASQKFYKEKILTLLVSNEEESIENRLKLKREELLKYSRKNPILKIFSRNNELQLRDEIKSLKREKEEKDLETESNMNTLSWLENYIPSLVQNKLDEYKVVVVQESLSNIKKKYQEFAKTLCSDAEVSIEICNNFVDRIIFPYIKEEKERVDYKHKLEQLFDKARENNPNGHNRIGTDPIVSELIKLTPSEFKYMNPVRNIYLSLLNRDSLVDLIEPLYLSLYNNEVNDLVGAYNLRSLEKNKLDKTFYEYTEYPKILWPNYLTGQAEDASIDKLFINDLAAWSSIGETPIIQKTVKKEYVKKDIEIKTFIYNKALLDSNGEDIDLLRILPDPESLKILLVLASSKHFGYRLDHVNGTLDTLSKRPDWQQLVEETIKSNINLKDVEDVLLGWNMDGKNYNDRDPLLYMDIQPYLVNLINDENNSKELNDAILMGLNEDNLLITFQNSYKDINLENIKRATILRSNEYGDSMFNYMFNKNINDIIYSILSNNLDHEDNVEYIIDHEGVNNSFKSKEVDRFLNLKALEILSEEIFKIIDDDNSDKTELNFLEYSHLVDYAGKTKNIDIDKFKLILNSRNVISELNPKNVKEGTGQMPLHVFFQYINLFDNIEGQNWFKDFIPNFLEGENQNIYTFMNLIKDNKLDMNRAKEIVDKYREFSLSQNFTLASEFPQLYLQKDEDIEFFDIIKQKYQAALKENNSVFYKISHAITSQKISREIISKLPEKIPNILDNSKSSLFNFILNIGNNIFKDDSDFKFIDKVINQYGNKAIDIIEGYNECLESKAITTMDKSLSNEFLENFQVLSPRLMKSFIDAKNNHTKDIFFSDLNSIASKLTGAGTITDKERQKDYFKDLIKHVYQNNAGEWDSYESNEMCEDRSLDLNEMKIKPFYKIDLLSLSEVNLKEGQNLDRQKINSLEKPIYDFANIAQQKNYDREALGTYINNEINSLLEKSQDKNLVEKLTTIEEKLLFIIGSTFYDKEILDLRDLKSLLISYEFSTNDDVKNYMEGTTDRVKRAVNMDYALLSELHSFYYDKMKESLRKIIEIGSKNSIFNDIHHKYFDNVAIRKLEEKRLEVKNKAQVDKLGLSDSFVKQIQKYLNSYSQKEGYPKHNYDLERTKRLIERYESLTKGRLNLIEANDRRTKGFMGQLQKQKNNTINAINQITNKEIAYETFKISDFDLSQLIEEEIKIEENNYDSDTFLNYLGVQFLTTFQDEKLIIEKEIDKYVSVNGNKSEVIKGYITKSKESANARMVGGVCVSGDNPISVHKERRSKNMWDMPNYFQLVLSEPDTYKCQGLVLLHHFTDENNKRILTASFNPSSTYINSIDQTGLFKGLYSVLEEFAVNNSFDAIMISENKTIRTNRTGTDFEKEMDRKVAEVNKKYRFSSDQQFSYVPNYILQGMDIIWERE